MGSKVPKMPSFHTSLRNSLFGIDMLVDVEAAGFSGGITKANTGKLIYFRRVTAMAVEMRCNPRNEDLSEISA